MGTNVFKLNENGDYEIVKIVPSSSDIKKEVPQKILGYFNGDENAESKIHRIGIADPQHPDFIAYNNAVEQFRNEADLEIAENERYLQSLAKLKISEGAMKQEIFVEG